MDFYLNFIILTKKKDRSAFKIIVINNVKRSTDIQPKLPYSTVVKSGNFPQRL